MNIFDMPWWVYVIAIVFATLMSWCDTRRLRAGKPIFPKFIHDKIKHWFPHVYPPEE